MSTTIDDVESVALQLPRAERARLAERLIASLDEDLAIEDRWKEEVRRRVGEMRAGTVPSIPGEQVFREIAEMLR